MATGKKSVAAEIPKEGAKENNPGSKVKKSVSEAPKPKRDPIEKQIIEQPISISKMGRPPANHSRKPFTSRCNPKTWSRIMILAMARRVEPGEIVEVAFGEYLMKHESEISDFMNL